MRGGAEAFRRQSLIDFQGLGVRGLGVRYIFAIAKVWGEGVGRAIRHFPGGAVGGLGGCIAGKLTMKIELPIFDFQGRNWDGSGISCSPGQAGESHLDCVKAGPTPHPRVAPLTMADHLDPHLVSHLSRILETRDKQ